jgi:hypothetical protein
MIDTAGRLDRKLKAEGLAIVGVSIDNNNDTTTWRVQPSELQAQAQPFIDAVDVAVWEQDEVWAELRVDRNTRLIASDWTQLPDVSVGFAPEDSAAWSVYRQALRDLPANTNDPANPVWPTSNV